MLAFVLAGPAAVQAQPVFSFDYSLDTNNFFPVGSPQRTTLETAGQMITNRLTDTLTAIQSDGVSSWSLTFPHPATGVTQSMTSLAVPANQIRVFAGGRDLPGSTLGQGGPGGFSVPAGTPAFIANIRSRGQAGALNPAGTETDFGPWGGAITFDTTGPTWNFDFSAPGGGESDFLSVALHELAHLIGFGLAPSFTNAINGAGTLWTGLASNALVPGVMVEPGRGHWANGTTYLGQDPAMDPSLLQGSRSLFSELDFAGLDDMGWTVTPIPEPSSLLLAGVAPVAVAAWRRRRAG
jgi:hypothetical protein